MKSERKGFKTCDMNDSILKIYDGNLCEDDGDRDKMMIRTIKVIFKIMKFFMLRGKKNSIIFVLT